MERPDFGLEWHDTIVIGGGQAGLSVGYQLARRGLSFVILDANERVGDTWRARWDSLRLFTPARFSGLEGMPFPGPRDHFPTKDEMADYLERYASRFGLPIQLGTRVGRLTHDGESFLVSAGTRRFAAANVVVAMSSDQEPYTPAFADELDPGIRQMHSIDYRNPRQLRAGPVALIGGGNTGADLAMELAPRHDVWLSGRATGHIPFRIEGRAGRILLVRLVLRVLFHRLFTVRTPIGRRMRGKVLHRGGPLVRVKPIDLARAGVKRVGRTVGVQDGKPRLEDGRVLDVTNVVWCTGFRTPFDWIDLPVLGADQPQHESGIVGECPGLYFVGLAFLHAMSSSMIHGVGRDAARIADAIERRAARLQSPDSASRRSQTSRWGNGITIPSLPSVR